jgi:DNA-binding SARP family transcriptional activator
MDPTNAVVPAPAAGLEIRLFGNADARVAGVPVKFAKRSTTLAMLAMLVLRRGHAMTRESLAFTLFPDAEEGAALAELRRYLYLASKALPERAGDPWLIVDAETVRWNDAAGAFVDVVAFEHFAAEPATHDRAIELYAGDLLEDIYEDWVVAERERLRSRYLAILSESIARHRAARDFPSAIASAKRLLATDPWREDAVRSLLAARYESGDSAGALAEYESFAKRLRDELAIAPMPETVAVRQSILRNDAVPGSLARPILTASPDGRRPIQALPFIGRERELATLHAAWTRSAHGTGCFVLISGEAGVGKTRLTAEFARTVQAEGGRVFAGTTAVPESTPYQAIVEALVSALPLLTTRPPAAARRAILARLIPALRETDDRDDAPSEPPVERETARLHDAIAHAIRSLASPRPLLLVLEDVQWAGSATIEALGAIVRDCARAPVLIVATCRDEEVPVDHPVRALLRSLPLSANAEEMELDRLGESDVVALLARIGGLRDRPDALARELYAHSEGNPLFLSEAVIAFDSTDARGSDAPTQTVANIIASRVARLGDSARTVAEIAAVAGAGCSVRVIREVSNLPATSVARGIDELLDGRILREASSRTNHDYVFTHHLIARTVYDGIEPAFRSQRHARIARVLEAGAEQAGSPSREIARHYDLGGDAERAGVWYLTAARESSAVYAYGDAIELAGRALALGPPAELASALHDLREKARGKRGDRAGQREDIDALEVLAGDDARALFDVLGRRVLLARTLGDSDDEGRLIARMDAVAAHLDDAARAHALLQRATHDGLRSRPADGIGSALAARDAFERLGNVRGILDCLFLLVDFSTNVGDLDAARAYLADMNAHASNLTDRAVEARALAVAGTAALLRAEYRECFELTSRALALNVETGDREAEAASRGRLAVTAAWLADYTTALREFDRALDTYESIGHKRGIALTHTNRTLPLMRLGLFDDALISIERSTAYFEAVGERRTIVANRVNASFVNLQRGNAHEAERLAASALRAAKEIGFPVFEAAALANLGNAERELGAYDAAIEHMTAGIAMRRPIQEPRDFADDLADLTLAYVAAGRTAEALATARELETIGEDGFEGSLWPHYVWWALSRGLAAAGDAEAAARANAVARQALERFAARIEDETTRDAFRRIAVNRRIAGA